jgi:hypothetical protein
MYFSVQISREEDGHYRAVCPELGLSTRDSDPDIAVDKLKSLILEWLTENAALYSQNSDNGLSAFNQQGIPSEFAVLNGNDGLRLLFIPRHTYIH